MGLSSWDWLLGQSRTLKCFLWRHSFVAWVVCLGSLLCRKTQPQSIFIALTDGRRFWLKLSQYMAVSNKLEPSLNLVFHKSWGRETKKACLLAVSMLAAQIMDQVSGQLIASPFAVLDQGCWLWVSTDITFSVDIVITTLSILGPDFLCPFRLLVHVAISCLIDTVSFDTCPYKHRPLANMLANEYQRLLAEFRSLMVPTVAKHGVEHCITSW